jgi:hypothetical protein
MDSAKKILRKINSDAVLKRAYNKLSPILFDVTLRDGIQKMDYMTTYDKIVKFNSIIRQMEPQNIEIGSLVSPKVLPIMQDTPQLFEECRQIIENMNPVEELRSSADYKYIDTPELYVLIPSKKEKYDLALNMGLQNISIMSSISESFLLANTNKNMENTKKDIKRILEDNDLNIKMYLSCINECPISGKIANSKVIDEINYYNDNYKLDEICLSDTCGTLNFNDFKEILDNSLEKIPSNRLSLHLHTNNKQELEKIIRYSLDKNVKKFDISAFENEGGCSVTIKNNLLNPNLTYDIFYEILLKYLTSNGPPDINTDNSSSQSIILPIISNSLTPDVPSTEIYDPYEEELIVYI